MERKTFQITFDHWGEYECPHNVMCDFCNNKEVAWWCEWLVTGYCEECMQEQSEEYAQNDMKKTATVKRNGECKTDKSINP